MSAISEARFNQNYLKPDGSERGFMEGFIGSMDDYIESMLHKPLLL